MKKSPSTRRWSRRLGALGLVALTITSLACGDSDDSDSDAAVTTESNSTDATEPDAPDTTEADAPAATEPDVADTEAPAPEEVIPLTVGVGRQDFLDSLVVIAEEQGFFEAEGLDVSIVTDTQGSAGMAALASGDVEVITSVWERMMSGSEEGLELSAFGLQMMRYPSSIAVKNDVVTEAGITDDQTVSEKMQALAEIGGIKVGLTNPGSSGEVFFRYVCSEAGIDCDASFDLIPIDDEGAMQVALDQGQVQAIVRTQPYTNIVAASSDASVIISGLADMPEFEDYVFLYAAAFKSTVEEKPEAFERYLRATDAARQFIEENPDEAMNIILDRTMEADDPNRAAAAEAWADYTTAIPTSVAVTVEIAQSSQDKLGEMQGRVIDFDPATLIDTGPSEAAGLAAG